VGHCEEIRKPARAGGTTGASRRRSMAIAEEENASTVEREASANASIPSSHFGGVKPLGVRSFVRREATPSGRAACAEPKDSVCARRDLIENERDTGARD
jgi:hypothetical protein